MYIESYKIFWYRVGKSTKKRYRGAKNLKDGQETKLRTDRRENHLIIENLFEDEILEDRKCGKDWICEFIKRKILASEMKGVRKGREYSFFTF